MTELKLKAAKYFLVVLLVVGVLATISWFLRNAIIERLSGPLLSAYNMTVTDVSLDALATRTAMIGYLELRHRNGTVIEIDDLTLPILGSTSGTKTYAAQKVTIELPIQSGPEPLALAQLIEQVLSLQATLPNTDVAVAELNIGAYPVIRDLRWTSTAGQQELTLNLGVVSLTTRIIGSGDGGFEVGCSLRQTSLNAPAQSISTRVRPTENGIIVSGVSPVDLRSVGSIASSIAASFGASLAGIEFADGAAIVEVDMEIPVDTTEPVAIRAQLTPAAPFAFAYSVTPGDINVVSVRSAGPITLQLTYPENRWSIGEGKASVSMSYQEWDDITASIADLNCSNGPRCQMNVDISMNNADLNFATASRLKLAAFPDVTFGDDGVQVLVGPAAELSLAGMTVSGTDLAEVKIVLRSTAKLELMESGWEITAESLETTVDRLLLTENTTFSSPVSLRRLSVSDHDDTLSVKAAIDSTQSRVTWNDRSIPMPGLHGDLSLQGDDLVLGLTTAGLHSEGKILVKHDLGSNTGRVSTTGASLSFNARQLSTRMTPWNADWDIAAGTFSADLQLNWRQSNSGWQFDGHSSLSMVDLAGAYADTAFAGLSTSFEADIEAATGITVSPAQIKIDLLEIGLPIENITADYTLRPDTLSVDVDNLRMHAFGGVVTADPFTYEPERERNTLLLHAESIELAELLSLQEFESIELSGRIGAELPVIIEGTQVSILNGTLTGESSGGVIRYRPEVVPDAVGTSEIGVVTKALNNFIYDSLTSKVGYSKDGDLVLQMRIAGRNPDLENSRPVVLNLGVENNIPEMLRSLQAARAVEDILEKRVNK